MYYYDIKDKTCGRFGINIHRAKPRGADDGRGNTNNIGLYSNDNEKFVLLSIIFNLFYYNLKLIYFN